MSNLLGLGAIPLGYAQTNSLGSAVKVKDVLGTALPAGCNAILMQCETANVRWTDDGTVPTASKGMELVAGAEAFFYTGAIANLQFIAASGSPVLDLQLYKVFL